MSQDKQLQESVMIELGWEPSIDAASIDVTAHAGVVTLTGHVQSFAQKVAAERATARVKGVKAVVEQIEVKLSHDIERGDESIAGAAIERLAWDSSVPPDAIEIRVEKGWITLNGEVGLALPEGRLRAGCPIFDRRRRRLLFSAKNIRMMAPLRTGLRLPREQC